MNDNASGAAPLIACHECGTVQHMRPLPEGGAAQDRAYIAERDPLNGSQLRPSTI
jgi:hypothetical protein